MLLFAETQNIGQDCFHIIYLEDKLGHVFVPDDDAFGQRLGKSFNWILLRQVAEGRRRLVATLASARHRMTSSALPCDQDPSAFVRWLLAERSRRQGHKQRQRPDDDDDARSRRQQRWHSTTPCNESEDGTIACRDPVLG